MAMLTWLADALRAEGIAVREVPGWKTRTRGFTFEGDEGVIDHHTASNPASGPRPALRTVTEGRSDLPGPLCHILVDRVGIAWVIAAGYANHAGLGGPWRTVPANGGNRNIVGIEIENNGIGERYSAETLETVKRCNAAILKRQRRDSSWKLGHKEWTSRKIDPSFSMDAMRANTRDYMKGDDMTPAEKDQLDKAFAFAQAVKRALGVGFVPSGEEVAKVVRAVKAGGITGPKGDPGPVDPNSHTHGTPGKIAGPVVT